MRSRLRLAFLALGSALAFGAAAQGGDPSSEIAVMTEIRSEWSAQVRDARARLVLSLEELNPGRRYRAVIELWNTGSSPISLSDQPTVMAELRRGGTIVPQSGSPRSGPVPEAQLGTVPRDAYLGVRVDAQTVGLPASGDRLLALGDKDWILKAGTYELRLRVVHPPSSNGAWAGSFDLPPVEVTVP